MDPKLKTLVTYNSTHGGVHTDGSFLSELEQSCSARRVIVVTEIVFANTCGPDENIDCLMTRIISDNDTPDTCESPDFSDLHSRTFQPLPEGLIALKKLLNFKKPDGTTIDILFLTAVFPENPDFINVELTLLGFCFFLSDLVLLSEEAPPLSPYIYRFMTAMKSIESKPNIDPPQDLSINKSYAKLTILTRPGECVAIQSCKDEFKTDEIQEFQDFFRCVDFKDFEHFKSFLLAGYHLDGENLLLDGLIECIPNATTSPFKRIAKYFSFCSSTNGAFDVEELINSASQAEEIMEMLIGNHAQKLLAILETHVLSSEAEITENHKILVCDILQMFQRLAIIGTPTYIQSVREELNYRLKTHFADLVDLHQNRIPTITTEIDKHCSEYADKMRDELECSEFRIPATLKTASSMYKAGIISSFKRTNATNYTAIEMTMIVQNVIGHLEAKEKYITMDNEKLYHSANEQAMETISSSIAAYSDRLSDLWSLGQSEMPEDVDSEVEELNEEIKNRFKKLNIHGPNKFQEDITKRLEYKMLQTFLDWHKDYKEFRDAHQKEINARKKHMFENVKAKIYLEALNLMNIDDIYSHQASLVDDAATAYSTTMLVDSSPPERVEACTDIVYELKNVFLLAATEVINLRKKHDEFYRKEVDTAVQAYTNKMTSIAKEHYLLSQSDIDDAHETYQHDVIAAFDIATTSVHHPRKDEFVMELKTMINKKLVEYKKLKDHYVTEFKKETEVEIAKIVDNFQNTIFPKLNTCRDLGDLDESYKDERNYARRKLKQNCTGLNEGILEIKLSQLQKSLESSYKDIKVGFLILLESRAKETKAAILEAGEVYEKEQTKYESNSKFKKLTDLSRFYEEVKQLIMHRFTLTRTLLPIQMQEIGRALDAKFRAHKKEFDKHFAKDHALGIDLGTTITCVAVYHEGEVKTIPSRVGPSLIPSYVCFKDDGSVDKVGAEAKDTAYQFAESTIFDAKRMLGRKFDDPEIQQGMKTWLFSVVNQSGAPKIDIGKNTIVPPEQVSAALLLEMKEMAEEHLGTKVNKAVITVPAYFSDTQRQATIDAGKCAGLEVLAVLPEPVAASVAFRLDQCETPLRHILIYDLGGGTFDVAILKISYGQIEAVALDGDSNLGGRDFDQNMMFYCVEQFKKATGVDLLVAKDSQFPLEKQATRRRLHRLQSVCENRKLYLSAITCDSVEIDVPYIYTNGNVKLDLNVEISRAKFEELNQHLFQKTITIVDKCIKYSGIPKDLIDDIVLVGGSTKIPKIRSMLRDYFDGAQLSHRVNPDEAVAHGAAVQAAILNGKISQGEKMYTKIQDITPMSLGIEVIGKRFSKIIPKHTKVPVTLKHSYTTTMNNQVAMDIIAFQGEDENILGNTKLGYFVLSGIPPAAKGVEKVDVTMEINTNGVLNVTAVSLSSASSKGTIAIAANKWLLTDREILHISNRMRNRVRSVML